MAPNALFKSSDIFNSKRLEKPHKKSRRLSKKRLGAVLFLAAYALSLQFKQALRKNSVNLGPKWLILNMIDQ